MKRAQIQLEDELMTRLKKLAKRNRMTLSEIIKAMCTFYDQFNVGFINSLENYYSDFKTSLQLPAIMQRLILILLAQRDAIRDAEVEVNGYYTPTTYDEITDDGLQFADFYKSRYDNFYRYEKERLQNQKLDDDRKFMTPEQIQKSFDEAYDRYSPEMKAKIDEVRKQRKST
jgi:hypothetical protein